MSKSTVINARVEPDLKEISEAILKKIGVTPTEAIRALYRQIKLRNGLPFELKIPNKLTKETIEKVEKGIELEEFSSLEEIKNSWRDL